MARLSFTIGSHFFLQFHGNKVSHSPGIMNQDQHPKFTFSDTNLFKMFPCGNRIELFNILNHYKQKK